MVNGAVERDSALYLTIGRNLALGRGYTFRGVQHHLAYPGLPLVFSGIFRIFHAQGLLPPLLFTLLLGLAALALTYRLFYLYAGRPTAVMMTVGLGMTRLFYRYCFELMSDLPFFVGVMAFLAGYEALLGRTAAQEAESDSATVAGTRAGQWYDWVLLLGGLAVAMSMRPAVWALLAAIVLAQSWRVIRRRASGVEIAVSLMIALVGAMLFYFIHSRRAGSSVADEYEGYLFHQVTHLDPLVKQAELSAHDLFESGTLIKSLFGCSLPHGINALVGIIIVVLGIWLFRLRVLWGLWATLTLAMLLMFKPVDRYLLPIIPLLMYGWWRMLFWMNHRMVANWGNWTFLALFFFGLGTNIARIGEMVVEQRRQPFLAHYRDGRYESTKRVSRLLRAKTGLGDCILAEPKVGRVMTFLADRDVYDSTDALTMEPGRKVFALLGPSWEEAKEGHPKGYDAVREWVAGHGMRLGTQVGQSIQGSYEHEPWMLYTVEPAR